MVAGSPGLCSWKGLSPSNPVPCLRLVNVVNVDAGTSDITNTVVSYPSRFVKYAMFLKSGVEGVPLFPPCGYGCNCQM